MVEIRNKSSFIKVGLLLAVVSVESANILLLSVPLQSHMLEVLHAVDELPKRGHRISLVVSQVVSVPRIAEENGIGLLRYKTAHKINFFDSSDFVRERVQATLTETREDDFRIVDKITSSALENCKEMMADLDFLSKIQGMDFDLAVVSEFTLSPCLAILPYHHSIPFVTVGTGYNPTMHAAPTLPSFVPLRHSPFSDVMSFKERLLNAYASWRFFSGHLTPGQRDTSLFTKYGRGKSDEGRNIYTVLRESILSIINTDPVLGYPVPTMPRIILAGGLTTKPPKTLPDDFNTIAEQSTKGMIVVSFGSVAAFLPEHITIMLAEAFSRVDYTVIWRHNGDISYELNDNVHIRSWLPQNDLLGHPKTKLFVTHCGNNGQFEALYNGIPMIGMHIWGDQHHNAIRVSKKGFGIKIAMADFTVSELIEKMNEVLTNHTYRSNIRKAAQIYRDRPMTARETSAFWIEHVLKYGSDHLKSGAMDLSWYAYLMLDIFFLVFAILVCSLIFIYICVCFVRKSLMYVNNNLEEKKKQ